MKHQSIELSANTITVTTYKASLLSSVMPTAKTIDNTCKAELLTELQAYLDLGYQIGKITKETRTILTSIDEVKA